MRKLVLVIFAIIMAVGLVLAGAGFALNGFNINGFKFIGDQNGQYTLREEQYDKASFGEEGVKTLTLDTTNADFSLIKSTDENVYVKLYESEKLNVKYEITAENGELSIRQIGSRYNNWLDYVNIFPTWNSGTEYRIEVKIPDDAVISVSLVTTNGNFSIEKNFDFENLDCKTTNSRINVDLSGGTVAKTVKLHSTNGVIDISNLSAKDFDIKTTNSLIKLNNVQAEEKIVVVTTNGVVRGDNVECADISVDTTNSLIDFTVIGDKNEYYKDLKTTNGRIRVDDDEQYNINANAPNKVKFKTTNGNIALKFKLP